jgi:hypothetical protein
MMCGDVTVASEPGKGLVFTVRLPGNATPCSVREAVWPRRRGVRGSVKGRRQLSSRFPRSPGPLSPDSETAEDLTVPCAVFVRRKRCGRASAMRWSDGQSGTHGDGRTACSR